MAIARTSQPRNFFAELAHPVLALGGAALLTLAFFIVLPVLQQISEGSNNDMLLTPVGQVSVEPPPPAPLEPEEPAPEPEPEETPPELAEDAPLMDLSTMELALSPGLSSGIGNAADFAVKLPSLGGGGGDAVSEMFSVGDLDQKPQVISRPTRQVPDKLKSRLPATIKVIFIVDERGRVVDPKVQSSTDPQFNSLAISTVKTWIWEPGKRSGQAVRFPVAQAITFEKAK